MNITSDVIIKELADLSQILQYSSMNWDNTCFNCRYSGDSITLEECDIVNETYVALILGSTGRGTGRVSGSGTSISTNSETNTTVKIAKHIKYTTKRSLLVAFGC